MEIIKSRENFLCVVGLLFWVISGWSDYFGNGATQRNLSSSSRLLKGFFYILKYIIMFDNNKDTKLYYGTWACKLIFCCNKCSFYNVKTIKQLRPTKKTKCFECWKKHKFDIDAMR